MRTVIVQFILFSVAPILDPLVSLTARRLSSWKPTLALPSVRRWPSMKLRCMNKQVSGLGFTPVAHPSMKRIRINVLFEHLSTMKILWSVLRASILFLYLRWSLSIPLKQEPRGNSRKFGILLIQMLLQIPRQILMIFRNCVNPHVPVMVTNPMIAGLALLHRPLVASLSLSKRRRGENLPTSSPRKILLQLIRKHPQVPVMTTCGTLALREHPSSLTALVVAWGSSQL